MNVRILAIAAAVLTFGAPVVTLAAADVGGGADTTLAQGGGPQVPQLSECYSVAVAGGPEVTFCQP